MSATIRLNIDDQPKIIVKPDQVQYIMSGYTNYNFIGVYPTVVSATTSGNTTTIHVYSPSGATGASGSTGQSGHTPTLIFNGSGSTVVNYGVTGTTYNINIYSPSGATGAKGDTGASGYTPTLVFIGSGSTVVNTNKTGNTYQIHVYAPSGATGAKGDSGNTVINYYTFLPSGGTILKTSGNTVTIYSPSGGTSSISLVGSGDTSVTQSGNTYIIYTPSGSTQLPTTIIGSGATIATYISGNTWNVYSPTGATGNYASQTDFTGHTGNTSIHRTSGDTQNQINDSLLGYWNSGQTIVYVSGQTSGLTPSWNNVIDKPSWLSGTTLQQFQTGHTHNYNSLSNKPDLTQYTLTGTTAALRLDLNTFTGATQTMYNDTYEVTGFIDNTNIGVSYNSTGRTITLTNPSGIYYYWNGKKHSLGTSWTSSGHTNNTSAWYLYSTDGQNFIWSTQAWNFNQLMLAYRPANTTICIREVHGVMQGETHKEMHRLFGCYMVSGFGLTSGTYALQPTTPTDAQNTFGLEVGVVADEDLQSSILAWPQDSYTRLYFTGTGATKNFQTGQALPFRMGATYPLINSWNGVTFSETEAASGRYFNYYVIRIPVTSDSGSQLYRAVITQPQFSYSSLAAAQAETTQSLNFGDLTAISPETVLVERITFRTQSTYNSATGRCRIESISILTGSRFSQTSTVVGVGTATAGNVSVTPIVPFVSTNLQDWTQETLIVFSQTGHTHSQYALKTQALTGGTSMSGTSLIHGTPVSANKLQLKGLFATGNLSLVSSTNGITISGGTDSTKANVLATIAAKTGTTYTALLADSGKILEFTASAATTITLPSGTTIPAGYQITCINYGGATSAAKTFVAGTGASIKSKGSKLKLETQYDAASAYYRGSNIWVLIGDLT